ncbi:hypothetical protein GCM10009111_03720 [Colwellia asteriadis]|uniref:Uncharacterized protein n=1 Tax=Colwellia asteriadis TaxID=517723 RepID=A0ABN1L2Y7_9GAMM
MKTVASKLELVAVNLGLKANDYLGVIKHLADILKYSKKKGVQLNAISSNIICDLILSITGVRITPDNLSIYKNNGYYLVQDVAKYLNINEAPSSRCCLSQVNGRWLMEPEKKSAISFFQISIKNAASYQVVAECYQVWCEKGMPVGDKRYWPKPELLDFLIEHQLLVALPVSHSKPTQLKIIFDLLKSLIESPEIACIPKQKLNDYFDNEIRKFSLIRKNDNPPKPWINASAFNNEINYTSSISAIDRTSPYFYIKRTESSSKIGSADNSDRFTQKDVGIVVCLESRANEKFALDVETKIREYLRCFEIHPAIGKTDHYDIPLKSLVNLSINFIMSTPQFSQRIRSISATYSH